MNIVANKSTPEWAIEFLDKIATWAEGEGYEPIEIKWRRAKEDKKNHIEVCGLSGSAHRGKRHISIVEQAMYVDSRTKKNISWETNFMAPIVHEYAHLLTRGEKHSKVFYEKAFDIAANTIDDGIWHLWHADCNYKLMASKVAVDLGLPEALGWIMHGYYMKKGKIKYA